MCPRLQVRGAKKWNEQIGAMHDGSGGGCFAACMVACGAMGVCAEISPDWDCGCFNRRWLPDEIGDVPFHVIGAMIAIPGSYLVGRIGGRMLAACSLTLACVLWSVLFADSVMWAVAHDCSACYRAYFLVGISILFGIEVLSALIFAWRRFAWAGAHAGNRKYEAKISEGGVT